MKTKIILFLAIFGLSFQSCKKDQSDFIMQSENSKIKSSNIKSTQLPNVQLDANGVITFDDFQELEDFSNALQDQLDYHYQNFLDQHSNLTTDQEIIDAMEIENYNEDQPLIDFENTFTNYTSLRSFLETEMENYLDGKAEFDWDDSPDSHFIIDEIDRTFINTDGAVKVGDTIYFPLDSGWLGLGPQGNYQLAVDDINNGTPIAQLAGPYRTLVIGPGGGGGGGGSPCTGCRANQQRTEEVKNGNKKLVSVLSIYTYPWASKVVAKAKGYKKTGMWWPKRWSCESIIYLSEVVNGQCNNPTSIGPISDPNRGWKSKAVIRFWNTTKKTECGKITGWNTSNGISKYMVINW